MMVSEINVTTMMTVMVSSIPKMFVRWLPMTRA